ncbi:TonB-linked SusC/RagA family outer membrane protein [Pedobacter africanus]|uniref:TonB-linked SusC/RagA family outer membrane protein n=1 Tax=Pedobacter africanus TaxID=151894 RepID=A0ACC6L1Y7_9SPHI|nr:TonB-dependent receptor [Pedobacter africanus]MDR6785378.1 TonB-linked SusC/RagA family outer membrane protein [Pedobacter africanus]
MRENYKNRSGLMILVILLFSSICSFAQQKTITGKVVDGTDNSTLPGVSIKVKGSQKTTSTDINGKYEILVSDADVLVFTYVGFLVQELPVAGKTILNVVLQPSSEQMQEVVVVGYGTQKKSDVSGAVATVSIDKATAIPTTNVAEMLRGQAAGVQITLGSARPGGTSNIQIRGRNSIRGGNDPLIVLDGFPIENINDVNPDDIASMEVLKDASAQAIYGARASNGVILITTKKGASGKVKIGLSSYLTTQRLTKNFDLYSAEEFAQLRREARRSINPGGKDYSPDEINFGGTAQAPEYVNFKAGNYVNWEDAVLRDALISSNTVSLSGGNEKTKVFTSATYFNQSGLLPSSGYKRGSFRFNIDQKINDRASIEANINMATDKQRRESANLDFITISPFTGPYDVNGNLVRNVAGANASSSTVNPLWNIRESANDIKTNFYNLNVVGNYKFTDNFSYKLNTLASRRFADEGRYISKLHSAGVTPNGSATVANAIREEYLIENILNYNAQIGNIHKLDFTLVQSINQRNTSRTESTGTGFGNDLLGYDGITNALNFKTTRAEEQYRLSSFLGRARYNLMDKYLVTLTARRDGASVFAENKKWGFFPAASVAWQMHRESFLKSVKAINQLKFRASYGAVGNQSLSPFTTLGVVDATPYIFGGAIVGGNLPGSILPNPNLTWETSTTFNAGLDFGLLDNRITGSLDYYNTHTTDLLADISLGGTSGFSSTITNGAESKNKGMELLLTGHIIRKEGLRWSVTTSFTKNTNQIVKTGIVDINGNAKDDIGRNRFVGRPINVIRTMLFDGIFQSDEEALASAQGTLGGTVTPFQNVATLTAGAIRIKDVNGDGVINDLDNVVIRTDPKWYGSLSTNFEYKGFELLADLYIVEGTTRYNPFLASFNEGGTLQSVRNGIKVNYWTPENPSTTHPRPNLNNAPANIGTMGVADASYVRLRTLSFGYNLPVSLLNKVNIGHAKIYLTATNLLTFTDYKSYSPENNPNDFPDTKAFTLGLNIGF